MARDKAREDSYTRPLRRILLALAVLALVGLFAFWRIDNPRAERLRARVMDQLVTRLDRIMGPVTALTRMAEDFHSYQRLWEQNQELRRELQKMKLWREAALQLEQENARLRALNRVRLDPELTAVTGRVIADSGSPFRRSVLLNLGARDGIRDGWAAMDGLGLVGRISGVGNTTARVLLVTDPSSRVPVIVRPSAQAAMVVGDNTATPLLEFLEAPDGVRPGDRVVTSGDGGVFPPGLLVGQVVIGADRRLRVRPAADLGRLEFLRVIRSRPVERVLDTGALLVPVEEGTTADSGDTGGEEGR